MDFPRIRLSEHSISILDFEYGLLRVDYTYCPVKVVRLLVFARRAMGGSKMLRRFWHAVAKMPLFA
jgi:hypothetical protein